MAVSGPCCGVAVNIALSPLYGPYGTQLVHPVSINTHMLGHLLNLLKSHGSLLDRRSSGNGSRLSEYPGPMIDQGGVRSLLDRKESPRLEAFMPAAHDLSCEELAVRGKLFMI
jgi:hypothetical protein